MKSSEVVLVRTNTLSRAGEDGKLRVCVIKNQLSVALRNHSRRRCVSVDIKEPCVDASVLTHIIHATFYE